LFLVLLKNLVLIWRRHRAAKFIPMLGAQGLWAGRDLYCSTPAVIRGTSVFPVLSELLPPFSRPSRSTRTRKGILRTNFNMDLHGSPFNRLLRHTMGCWGAILPGTSWAPIQSPHTTCSGMLRTFLTRDLTSPLSVASHDTQGDAEDHSNPEPHVKLCSKAIPSFFYV
jgi:hypothetical protein